MRYIQHARRRLRIIFLWFTIQGKFNPTDPIAHINNSVALVREQTIPTERPPLVGEVSAKFCGLEGCRVVSAADSYGRNIGFLDQSISLEHLHKVFP
jgi:hypothetical protein